MSLPDDFDLSRIWAARVALTLKPNTPEYAQGYRGAYTTILVRCESAEQFLTAAKEHVDREGFTISGIERLFLLIAGEFELNDTMKGLVERTREYPVQWFTFHLFKGDA
jgi:hypothetical protein